MIGFLKNFFANEKTSDEQALLAAQQLKRQRDVMVVEGFDAAEGDEDDNALEESCAPRGGCCGGGCRG